MKVAEETRFRKTDAPHPLLGLNSEDPSTQMDPSYATAALNILIRDGKASSRTGYHELIASVVAGTAEIMALIDFELLDTTRQFVIVTAKQVLKFDTATNLFVDISPLERASGGANTAYTINGINTGTETVSFSGNHASEFVVGSNFTITGSSGNNATWYVSTVANNGGNTDIVVTGNITDSTADGVVNAPHLLTSVDGDNVDWVVATDASKHRLFITNNRDNILTWDGSAVRCLKWIDAVSYPSDPAESIVCKTLSVFFDHLILGNVSLGSSAATAKSVIWSDVTDFDEFKTGTSGEALIPALAGEILTLEPLGDRLVVYSEDTIALILFVGFPLIFSFEIIVQDTRLVSARAVVGFGPVHLYCSQENIYFFDGTRNIRPVADKIRILYKQDLDTSIGNRFFTFNDVIRRLIFISVPVSSTVTSTFVFDYSVFDLSKFRWTRYLYTDRPTTMGFFLRRAGGLTWADNPIAWEDDTGIWDEASEKVDFPIRVLGAKGQVFLMDETVTTDDTVDVTSTYESIDFVVPEANISHIGRWMEIEGDFTGASVEVLFSTDQGSTFTSAETLTLTSIFTNRTVFIDTSSRTLRVRLTSTSQFSLRWIRVWTSEGSAR